MIFEAVMVWENEAAISQDPYHTHIFGWSLSKPTNSLNDWQYYEHLQFTALFGTIS
jgi:hypothetical protein